MTVTASNPWPWENMLRNMNKCENVWSNFSASFRLMALKLPEWIRFSLPNQRFSSISYVPIEPWVTSLWAIVFFALSLRLLSLVYIYFGNSFQKILLFWFIIINNVGVSQFVMKNSGYRIIELICYCFLTNLGIQLNFNEIKLKVFMKYVSLIHMKILFHI